MNFTLLSAAYAQLDNIYDYTLREWGEDQAIKYTSGLFDCFARIAAKEEIWRPVPTEFEIDGYFTRYQKHFVYWKITKEKKIAIVAILHERMHQIDRLLDSLSFE